MKTSKTSILFKVFLSTGIVFLLISNLSFSQTNVKNQTNQTIAVDVDAFKKSLGLERFQKLQTRLAELNQDIYSKGMLSFPETSDKLLTGYAYGEFYDWDLYFENLYLTYYGISDFCFSNFKVFMSRQKPDGFISRSLIMSRPKQIFKPFLAQIAVLGSKQNGNNFEWLRGKYYIGLRRYIDRWLGYDADHNGLPVWQSADHSGMDNQRNRNGDMPFQIEGIDLACYIYRELQSMAIIAEKLGIPDDKKAYLEQADGLAKKINEVFWDEKDGIYYDRNEVTGKMLKVKSVSAFIPLWIGVASQEQANRLVKEHLINEKEFWFKYPVSTYAATEPDYYQGRRTNECNWRGPTWIPTNYMIFHGLMHYGFKDIAKDLAYRTLSLALDENSVTREFYDSDTGKGNGMDPFWGWSSLAYVMPLEYEIGYDPTDLNAKIRPLLSKDLSIPWPKK